MMQYNGHELEIRRGRYGEGNNLALILYGGGEFYAVLTINFGYKLSADCAFVDLNNVPWAEDFIEEFQLGKPLGMSRVSGFCTYPLYKFYIDKIEEVD